MDKVAHELALRKQLLLARSSLCRLKIRHDVAILRTELSWPQVAAVAAGTPAVRSAAFLLAVEFVGPERTARLLAFAARTLAIARLAGVALAMLRKPSDEPATPK